MLHSGANTNFATNEILSEFYDIAIDNITLQMYSLIWVTLDHMLWRKYFPVFPLLPSAWNPDRQLFHGNFEVPSPIKPTHTPAHTRIHLLIPKCWFLYFSASPTISTGHSRWSWSRLLHTCWWLRPKRCSGEYVPSLTEATSSCMKQTPPAGSQERLRESG